MICACFFILAFVRMAARTAAGAAASSAAAAASAGAAHPFSANLATNHANAGHPANGNNGIKRPMEAGVDGAGSAAAAGSPTKRARATDGAGDGAGKARARVDGDGPATPIFPDIVPVDDPYGVREPHPHAGDTS